MIQTQPPQQPERPRNAYEIRLYLKQLSRDMAAVYKEFKQHSDLLLVLQQQAYAELELIEGRQLESFNWPAQPQQVRVAPASMPLAPRRSYHLSAGQQVDNHGRMRFVEASEEPTLPDPSPWGEVRRTNG